MITVDSFTIIINSEKATLEDKIDLEASINNIVAEGGKQIFLDLGCTTYIPSELMGLLMWKKKELLEKGVHIKIIRITGILKIIFDNAMLTDFFEINSQTLIVD